MIDVNLMPCIDFVFDWLFGLLAYRFDCRLSEAHYGNQFLHVCSIYLVDICWTASAVEIDFWCCAVRFGFWICYTGWLLILLIRLSGEIGSLCKDCFVFSLTHLGGIMEIVWCSHVCSSSILLISVELPRRWRLIFDVGCWFAILDDCDSLEPPKRWDWLLMLCWLIRFLMIYRLIIDFLLSASAVETVTGWLLIRFSWSA